MHCTLQYSNNSNTSIVSTMVGVVILICYSLPGVTVRIDGSKYIPILEAINTLPF